MCAEVGGGLVYAHYSASMAASVAGRVGAEPDWGGGSFRLRFLTRGFETSSRMVGNSDEVVMADYTVCVSMCVGCKCSNGYYLVNYISLSNVGVFVA